MKENNIIIDKSYSFALRIIKLGCISNFRRLVGHQPGQRAVGGVLTAHFKATLRKFEMHPIKLYLHLRKQKVERELLIQLLKSGTSIGVNVENK